MCHLRESTGFGVRDHCFVLGSSSREKPNPGPRWASLGSFIPRVQSCQPILYGQGPISTARLLQKSQERLSTLSNTWMMYSVFPVVRRPCTHINKDKNGFICKTPTLVSALWPWLIWAQASSGIWFGNSHSIIRNLRPFCNALVRWRGNTDCAVGWGVAVSRMLSHSSLTHPLTWAVALFMWLCVQRSHVIIHPFSE